MPSKQKTKGQDIMENNKMLINVCEDGGIRVAVLKRGALYDLDVAYAGIGQKKSNIYKGFISRVEPSLGAAFVDYGAERHGFLPLKEISKNYFVHGFSGDFSRLNIRDVVKEGQELIVQVEKEERGGKGAALTTFISLAGSYVVLMPNNPRAGGISRRIDGEDRDELRETLRNLNIPEDMGVIVRTAGIGRSTEELQWDLNNLLQLWETILRVNRERPSPFLIYQESDTAIRAVRDYLKDNLAEIVVDQKETFEKIKEYINLVRSEFIDRIKLYENNIPLFSHYQIEKQIESAYKRVVRLPSGGAIVIDHTEALVSIDVNSAKATGGSGIEETALNTNLEAADEIARQLRIRDIGGLIVIDFIDMDVMRNQREVGQRLRDALQHDRARVQVGNITRFGLLEMSRQRLRPHLSEAIQVVCPRCEGQATIRSIESLASSILHLLQEEAIKEKVTEVQAQVPTDLATYLLNERRVALNQIETQQQVRVLILPNQHLETPKYKIKSVKRNDTAVGSPLRGSGSGGEAARAISSYKLLEEVDTQSPQKQQSREEKGNEKPAITTTFAPLGNSHHNTANTATAGENTAVTTMLTAETGKITAEKGGYKTTVLSAAQARPTKPSLLSNAFKALRSLFGTEKEITQTERTAELHKNLYRRRQPFSTRKQSAQRGGSGSIKYRPGASSEHKHGGGSYNGGNSSNSGNSSGRHSKRSSRSGYPQGSKSQKFSATAAGEKLEREITSRRQSQTYQPQSPLAQAQQPLAPPQMHMPMSPQQQQMQQQVQAAQPQSQQYQTAGTTTNNGFIPLQQRPPMPTATPQQAGSGQPHSHHHPYPYQPSQQKIQQQPSQQSQQPQSQPQQRTISSGMTNQQAPIQQYISNVSSMPPLPPPPPPSSMQTTSAANAVTQKPTVTAGGSSRTKTSSIVSASQIYRPSEQSERVQRFAPSSSTSAPSPSAAPLAPTTPSAPASPPPSSSSGTAITGNVEEDQQS
jgi:ribonuclease E